MRVLVVDDVELHRAALAGLLSRYPAITAVRTAGDESAALLDLTAVGDPTIVVLSMRMPDSVRLLRRLGALAPVIVMAMCDDDVIACAEAGAAGFLLREQPLSDLLALLESVVRGETRCSPRVAATLLRRVTMLTSTGGPPPLPVRLTPREQEVLELIGDGLSNKQIATRLCIELRTVKNHVHHILEKYQVHRRADAAARFRTAVRF